MPLALSTGHEVGLGVTALVFIVFALASSFLFPRIRPDYPGKGLLAFIVVALVFFFGMLTAVEVFGAEETHGEAAAETTPEETATTTQPTTTTTPPASTSTPNTTTTATKPPEAAKIDATETEFKITLSSTDLKAGPVTFEAKNAGKIAHDLAIKGTSDKTKEIAPGGKGELKVTLKPGTYEVYCTLPGHEQAGMKINITVS